MHYDIKEIEKRFKLSIGDEFCGMELMHVPSLGIFVIFVQTKSNIDWDEIVAEGKDAVEPYFYDLGIGGVEYYFSPCFGNREDVVNA